MLPLKSDIEALIDRALMEDLSLGDATTEALIPPDVPGEGKLFAKSPGVLCGVPVAIQVFKRVDPALQVEAVLSDGDRLERGSTIIRLQGSAASMLSGERTAVNILQHLSGIATETAKYAERVKDLPVRIVDTRKTIPGIRSLQKYAVHVGGGGNHRKNLGDGILIKDNHLAVLRAQGKTFKEIIQQAVRNASHTIKVEVEVTSLDELRLALEAGAQIIMLDNMPVPMMREAVQMVRGKAIIEASGGITLDTIRAVAETGVHLISVGALTHSVKSLDVSMDVELAKRG
ncbi:MAG: carboxylating nicotinate-nucleotide diphosphorylase [Dehalococcoidia bacterium]|nr:carboxylating nicotinate-nucleotide diphosphorylase [Dehalococcoidia bacterium]